MTTLLFDTPEAKRALSDARYDKSDDLPHTQPGLHLAEEIEASHLRGVLYVNGVVVTADGVYIELFKQDRTYEPDEFFSLDIWLRANGSMKLKVYREGRRSEAIRTPLWERETALTWVDRMAAEAA